MPRAEHYLLDVLRLNERAHSRAFSDAWGAQGIVGGSGSVEDVENLKEEWFEKSWIF